MINMYSSYGFVLNWYDLSEELRGEKISAFIQYNYQQGDYTNPEGEHEMSLDQILGDIGIRTEVERQISAYFPIYF